jgi:RimJ/RimL family protein N-acetyltransferase
MTYLDGNSAVFHTERLTVQLAGVDDVALFYALWTNPAVMSHVGFPQGLPITQAEIVAKLEKQPGTVFGRLLLVVLQATGERMGECFMTWPDAAGIAETDVKLLPAFWGHQYGVEIKRGLLDYLFSQTDCQLVQATPNIHNIASIKMQEAVGAVRVGEETAVFPPAMHSYTQPVQHYLYQVSRSTWESG